MSNPFQNMRLDGILLAGLYGSCLNEGHSGPVAELSSLSYLGGNKKNIAVLVNNPEDVFLPDNELAVLNRILSACGLDSGDVAIVNMANAGSMEKIIAQLSPEKTLSFGAALPDGVAPFEPRTLNGTTFLLAPALASLAGQQEETEGLKRKLWTCLRQLFKTPQP